MNTPINPFDLKLVELNDGITYSVSTLDDSVTLHGTGDADSTTLPGELLDLVQQYISCKSRVRRLRATEEDLQRQLMEQFAQHGIHRLDAVEATVTHFPASERSTLDTRRLKAQYPFTFQDCLHTIPIAPSIRVAMHA